MPWGSLVSGLTSFWNTWGSTILKVGTSAYGYYQGYKSQKDAKKEKRQAMGMAQAPQLATYGTSGPGALPWLEGRMPAAGERAVEMPGYPTSLLETRGLAQGMYQKQTPSAQQLANWARSAYGEATQGNIQKALPEIQKLIGPKMVYHGEAPMETMNQLMTKYLPYKEQAAAVASAPQVSNMMQTQWLDMVNKLWGQYQSGDIDYQKLRAEVEKVNQQAGIEWGKLGLTAQGVAGTGLQGYRGPDPKLLYGGSPMGKTAGAGNIGQWAGLLKGFGGTLSDYLSDWGYKQDPKYATENLFEQEDPWIGGGDDLGSDYGAGDSMDDWGYM